MIFSVTDFLASLDVKVFETLKKEDLIALGMPLVWFKYKISRRSYKFRLKLQRN